MPFGSHGTSFERYGEVRPEEAGNWTAAFPYFQIARSIIPMSELPDDDKNMNAEIRETVTHLLACPNSEARGRADEGDVEAAIDYGLR